MHSIIDARNRNRNRLPSPALLVAVGALVVALGGSAAALPGSKTVDENDLANNVVDSASIAKQAVKGSDIAAGAVKGKQLADASVAGAEVVDGAIGGAEIADGGIAGADVADGAIGGAEIGNGAVAGAEIADASVTAADLADPEPPTTVTAFGNGGQNDCRWSVASAPALGPVSFYKDPMGIVHLNGVAEAVDGPGGDATCDDVEDGRVFVLPAGYQPDTAEVQGAGEGVIVAPDEGATIGPDTLPPGTVYTIASIGTAALDGITFRPAGPAAGSAGARAAGPAALPALDDLEDLLAR